VPVKVTKNVTVTIMKWSRIGRSIAPWLRPVLRTPPFFLTPKEGPVKRINRRQQGPASHPKRVRETPCSFAG
jgi:hypothetical protein